MAVLYRFYCTFILKSLVVKKNLCVSITCLWGVSFHGNLLVIYYGKSFDSVTKDKLLIY